MTISASQSRSIELLEVTADSSGVLAEAKELLVEYGQFVISQPGVARFCFGSLLKEAQRLPVSYQERGGGCLLARVAGQPTGFVAWRALDSTAVLEAWELKRLWVRTSARGLGLGRTLTLAVLERAANAGMKAVYLDTVPEAMPAAHRLYLDMGFIPCAQYNDNPVEGLAYLTKHI